MKNKFLILIIVLSFWRCTVSTCECCKTETIFDSNMPIMASTHHNNMPIMTSTHHNNMPIMASTHHNNVINLQLTEGDLLGV